MANAEILAGWMNRLSVTRAEELKEMGKNALRCCKDMFKVENLLDQMEKYLGK